MRLAFVCFILHDCKGRKCYREQVYQRRLARTKKVQCCSWILKLKRSCHFRVQSVCLYVETRYVIVVVGIVVVFIKLINCDIPKNKIRKYAITRKFPQLLDENDVFLHKKTRTICKIRIEQKVNKKQNI